MSTEKQSTAVAKKQTEITDIVMKKVVSFQQSGELHIPESYSPQNALKSAYLVLNETTTKDNKPVLQHCSQTSIANALLKMVVFGLSPLKQQLYFVPFGNKLECTVSYTGEILLAKRYANLKHITANLIMEGDDFQFEIDSKTGRKKIIAHKQTLESIGAKNIVGAYAIYELEDGTTDMEIMNWEMIQKSWGQSPSKGNSPAIKNFPGEMAKRTVIRRAIKLILRSSDDANLFSTRSKEDIDVVKENVDHEISEHANEEIIDIESEPFEEEVIAEEQKPNEKPQEEGKPQNSSKQSQMF